MHPDPGRPAARRFRNRALYNRRIQRDSEHWPLVTQLGSWLFSHPGLLLAVLGDAAAGGGRRPGAQPEHPGAVVTGQPCGGAFGCRSGWHRGYDPAVMRPQLTRMARLAMPIRTDVHVTGRVVPGPAGAPDIPLRVYRQFGTGIGGDAGGGSRPGAIVYFHGGGWVTGDLDSHDSVVPPAGRGQRVHRGGGGLPAGPRGPVSRCRRRRHGRLRVGPATQRRAGSRPGQVGVMGDSAGGNLAAVVALETRPGAASAAADVPPPVAQGLVYPALDARLDSESMRALSDGFFLTRESMEFFRSSYLPEGTERQSPRALAAAGPRPPRAGAGAGGDRRVRSTARRRRPLCRRPAAVGRRGRVPLLRRPGARVHGHGLPPRLLGTGHRGLRRHGPADAPIDAGRQRERAHVRTDRTGPATARLPGLYSWTMHEDPGDPGPGRRRRVEPRLHLRRRAAGRVRIRPGAGAAHRGGLRAPRAAGGRGGRVVCPAGRPGRGADGPVPCRRRGRGGGRGHRGGPASSI